MDTGRLMMVSRPEGRGRERRGSHLPVFFSLSCVPLPGRSPRVRISVFSKCRLYGSAVPGTPLFFTGTAPCRRNRPPRATRSPPPARSRRRRRAASRTPHPPMPSPRSCGCAGLPSPFRSFSRRRSRWPRRHARLRAFEVPVERPALEIFEQADPRVRRARPETPLVLDGGTPFPQVDRAGKTSGGRLERYRSGKDPRHVRRVGRVVPDVRQVPLPAHPSHPVRAHCASSFAGPRTGCGRRGRGCGDRVRLAHYDKEERIFPFPIDPSLVRPGKCDRPGKC